MKTVYLKILFHDSKNQMPSAAFDQLTQLFRHVESLNSGDDLSGGQRGHAHSSLNSGRADVRDQDAIGQSEKLNYFHFDDLMFIELI